MDDNVKKLRKAIRKHIKRRLEEISTTAGVPGYLTPNAFVGDSHTNREKIKKVAKSIGYSLTKRGEKDVRSGDKLQENYYEFRNDVSKQPHQKIGASISEINQQLKLIERAFRMNMRLQKEYGVTNDKLWKRTASQLVKLEAKLVAMAAKTREMRG